MHCGDCSHDNEPNAKFCSECGAPLAHRCPSCDAVQPAGSNFCNQCGTAITASAPVTTSKTGAEPTAVRKNVTALFGDLVGSTSFGEQVDAEATRAAMADYFELLRSTIEDHAGTVVKFMGDGVLAVFGVPVIAEDDAARAVAAGIELQRRFRSFAESVRARHGVELGLRVGVNTGELVIGDDDADMVGDVLNTAARLEAACLPGRVLVGEDTWRSTRSSVTYEVLGEIRVKGKAESIATFQVNAEVNRTTDEPTPFVGRQQELAELRTVLTQACDNGTARLATVIGAPGVGKTRLAAELRGTSDARSFDLRFERRGSTTFTPIAELLRELTGGGSADDVARLVRDHPDAGRLSGILASFLGHGDTSSTEESFWAVRRLLEMVAADDPVIIVVDDIQWAEPLFWDLLDHLVEWTSAPVFIVALARPELRELKPELAQPGRRVTAAVALEGLDAATTGELAARLLDTDELPADLIDRLPDSTEGNPLFVRELVQMLVDDGVLARSGDRWRLTIDVDAIEVPPTILSLLASRVERLPDDERQVVELASVIGTEFDRGALGAIAGGDLSARLGAVIDRLRRKDLVEPSGAWSGDHPVYRFHHVLIRDAAYRRLLKGHRANLHEQVGRYLESGTATDELDVMIAHHYEQVHRYRAELGTIDDVTRDLAGQASRRLRTASEQALAREDLSSAGGYALRALALTDDGVDRDELLVLGCEALLSSGDTGRGAALAVQLSERSDDERLAAWADCFRAQLWSLIDAERLIEASDLADAAAARLEALDDQAGVAKARLVRASTLARLGRVGDGEAELDLALGAARAAGDRRRTVAVLGAAPVAALWGPSPVARAGGRCLDVLRLLGITTTSPAVEATSVRCQGVLEALRGRFDSARDKFEASRTTARELGLRNGLYETEMFAGFVELLADDPIAAEPHLALARDGLGALGIGADAGQAGALLARSLLLQGRIDEADAIATSALEAAGQNLQTAIASRAVLGEIRAAQGRHDDAERLTAEAIEIAERTDITLDHALALQAAARVARAAGRASDAAQRADRASRLLADKGATVVASEDDEPGGDEADDTAAPDEPAADGSDRTERVTSPPTNAAFSLIVQLRDAFDSGDLDGIENLLHPEMRTITHVPMTRVLDEQDRATLLVQISQMIELGGVMAIESIAVRDDNLCLARVTIEVGGTPWHRYVVVESSGDRIRLSVWFDDEQVITALDELDRRWGEQGAPRPVVDNTIALRRAWASGDADAIRSLVRPGVATVDHRQLGLGTRSVDEWVESNRLIIEGDRASVFISREFLRVSSHGMLVAADLEAASGDSAWDMLIIVEVDPDGISTHTELFDRDDFEAAIARFEGLARDRVATTHSSDAPEPTNRAWKAFASMADALATGDRQIMRGRFESGYRTTFRFGLGVATPALDVETMIDNLLQMVEQGLRRTTRCIAVRGDDLVLCHVLLESDAARSERYFALRTNDGRWASAVSFDETQLIPALDELDRLWTELGGPAELVTMLQGIRHALDRGTPAELRELVSDDFTSTDHRQLGMGTRTADEWVDSLSAAVGRTDTVLHEVVAHTDRLLLSRTSMRVRSDDALWEAFGVHEADDEGRVVRWDLFPLDAHAAARARYDELVSERAPAQDRLDLVNAASELGVAFTSLVDPTEQEVLAYFRDDFEYDRRQPAYRSLDVSVSRREQFIRDMLTFRTADGYSGITGSVVAIRADSLALVHSVEAYGEDEMVVYRVAQVSGNRFVKLVEFDGTQLDEALGELDRQWAELGGPIEHIEPNRRYREVFASGTRQQLRELISDDFESVDHRPLGLGVRHAQEWLESIGEFAGSTNVVMAAYLGIDGLHCLTRGSFVLRDSGDVLVDGLVVTSLDDVGLLRRLDLFDLDQLDAARARFDELTTRDASTQATAPAFTNRAYELARAIRDAYVDADRHRFVELMTPDFVAAARYRLNVGQRLSRDGFADSIFAQRGWGDTFSQTMEPIAIRDDDLCLVRTELRFDENLMEYLIVLRSDGERLANCVLFDETQLDEALDELDRQWAGSGGPQSFVTAITAFRAASSPEAVRSLFDEHFVDVDHRPLGLGRRTVDEWVASLLWSRDDEGHGSEFVVSDVRRHSERVALWRATVESTSSHAEWGFWRLTTLEDGRFGSGETFALDQFDEAVARYDQLADGISNGISTVMADVPSNAATRFITEFWSAWQVDDIEGMLRLIDPEFVARILVPIVGVVDSIDREQWIDLFGAVRAQGIVVGLRPLAVRGDDLCLIHADMVSDDGTSERYGVFRLRDGRAIGAAMFDQTQFREALGELDRQWIATGAPATTTQLNGRAADTLSTGPLESFAALFAPDFLVTDHRPLGLGARTFDEFLASIEALAGNVVAWRADVPACDDRTSLSHIEMRSRVDGSAWSLLLVAVHDGARVTRWDQFTIDDLAAARACYEEARVHSRARSSRGLVNPEVVLTHRFVDAWKRRDLDVDEFVEPDFTFAGRRSSAPAIDGGAGVLREIYDYWTENGLEEIRIEWIAIRGDELGLARETVTTRDGDEFEVLALGQLGASGRWKHIAMYDPDQMVAAQIELDRRHLDSLGYADDHVLRRMFSLGYTTDPTAVATIVHPDLEYVDHRPLAFVGGDRTRLIEVMDTLDVATQVVVPQIHRLGEHAAVAERRELTVDGLAETHWVGVYGFEDGLVRRLEIFALEDFDAALAHYDELVAGAGIT